MNINIVKMASMTTRHERQPCDTTTIDQFRHTETTIYAGKYRVYIVSI